MCQSIFEGYNESCPVWKEAEGNFQTGIDKYWLRQLRRGIDSYFFYFNPISREFSQRPWMLQNTET